jgi:post-segregation antitoxin (ccd killing protein)
MTKLAVIHTIRFTDKQAESLQKLKEYDVNVSQFIRLAIKEKILRDWKSIKEKKETIKLPF